MSFFFFNNRSKQSHSGFTLIELLVVVTIIIALTVISVVSYRTASMNSRDAKRKTDLETVRQALVLYRSDKGFYPQDGSFPLMINKLNSTDYLSDDISKFQDPGSNPYVYTPTASGFILTATLENPPGTYTLTNP